ncbi:MAG: acyltransferase [Oscillospiraceae bacterium]|jgi:membrane-bound acyltransferase YfiQ involved in biofilm formation|nr:acyltransferase [Oscillospiraceae bacterium]
MTATADRDRKLAISITEVALCALVVFIHIASDTVSNGEPDSPFTLLVILAQKLAGFAMPGFIFASALKITLGRGRRGKGARNYVRFIVGRVRRVYAPYMLWVVIFYLFFVCIAHYFPFSLRELGNYILRGNLVAHFYFIIVVMQFHLLAPAIERAAEKYPIPTIALSVIITCAALTASGRGVGNLMWDRVFPSYLVYWTLGTYVGLNYDKLRPKLTQRRVLTASLCVAIAVPLLLLRHTARAQTPSARTSWKPCSSPTE